MTYEDKGETEEDAIAKKVFELSQQSIRLGTKCQESISSVAMLIELNHKVKSPHIMKALMGRIRDQGCDLIAYGQNLRRQADLIEPTIDDQLRGETPK